MPKHERMKLPRQGMPTQDAQARARNFDEVALGYPEETSPAGGGPLPAVQATQVRRRVARWRSTSRPLSSA